MKGERVVVRTRILSGYDEFHDPVYTYADEDVDNVLVAPGARHDVIESTRPDGAEVNYTLYFPKTFVGDLEGSKVVVRGEALDVIGHPDRFDPCPTGWNMVVEVGAVHG